MVRAWVTRAEVRLNAAGRPHPGSSTGAQTSHAGPHFLYECVHVGEPPARVSVVSELDEFQRILASLYRAALDGTHWPSASALIEEACGARGNALMAGEGAEEAVRVHMVGLYYRGERREDLEREYVETYHPIDEMVAPFRRQPYGRLVRVADLYSEKDLKRSETFNEFHRRTCSQNGLIVRVEAPVVYRHFSWVIGDPIGRRDTWSSSQVEMVKRVVPHVRQLLFVRQALADAGALGRPLTELLDARRLGVILLDRQGRILAANDSARGVLRQGDGLSDRGGILRARRPADRARLAQLLSGALPQAGSVAVGGSVALSRENEHRRFVIHVKPTIGIEGDLSGRWPAALILIVDPWLPLTVDVGHVTAVLGLTPAESEVAAWLAEGKTVGEIAANTGRQKRSIYWHLEQIYAKLGVRRQVDLVRVVLAASEFA